MNYTVWYETMRLSGMTHNEASRLVDHLRSMIHRGIQEEVALRRLHKLRMMLN